MANRNEKSYWHDWHSEYLAAYEGEDGTPYYGKASVVEQKILRALFKAIGGVYNLEIHAKPVAELARYPSDFREAIIAAYQLTEAGVIGNVRKEKILSDEPKIFRYFASVKGARASGQNGMGSSFFSETSALWAALGEAVDRYSLIHFAPQRVRDFPFTSIASKALDIFSMAGISDDQRRKGHPRFQLSFNDKTVFRWVEGHSMTRGERILVPLQLVTFYHWPRNREPYLRLPISTGSAAGKTLTQALYRGILEVVERDAFMIIWLKRLSPPRIDIRGFKNERIRKITELFERYRLELSVLELPTDVPCHVIMATIIDRRPGFAHFTIGLRASLNLEEAIIVAVQEALSARFFLRDRLSGIVSHLPDLAEVEKIKRLERVYIWAAMPELEARAAFLWEGNIKTSFDSFLSLDKFNNDTERLKFLVNHFKREGTEVAYVQNLPNGLRGKIPFTSVVVLIPEFQPMHLDEALPYFSGKRLETIPKKLGFHSDGSINTIPHPFP